ncbi:MAG: membrane dipeptidase [Myxococcota bacterium]
MRGIVWLVLGLGSGLAALVGIAGCGERRADVSPPAPSPSAPADASSAVPVAPSASVSVPASARAPETAAAAASPPRVTLAAEGDVFEVVDLHVDTPWRVHFKGRPKSLPEGHATPDKVREGRYAAMVHVIYIPDYIHDWKPGVADAEAIFDTIDGLVAAHPTFVPAVVHGTRAVVPPDDVAIFFAIEGAGAFAADVTAIDRFIARGVRLVGPVHAHDNALASSATGERAKKKGGGGLTDVGKRFCARVYERGALVDVSHMSDRAFEDLVPIAERYGAPIVATHSNARAVRGHPRNLPDEHLEIIRRTGGVAGLNFHRSFVRRGQVEMRHVVAMVDHMVKVAGIDAVAIGSDYDGGNPVGPLSDASQMPALARALLDAGYSPTDVRKIFGGNALRVLEWGGQATGPGE